MDLIEEGRNLLNLIKHDPGPALPVTHQRFEPVGINRKLELQGGIQQIQHHGARELLPEPSAFARPPCPKEEE